MCIGQRQGVKLTTEITIAHKRRKAAANMTSPLAQLKKFIAFFVGIVVTYLFYNISAEKKNVSLPEATLLSGSVTWQAIALETGTDKSGDMKIEPCASFKAHCHNYSAMYEELLAPYRSMPVKVLEIGLGCDMIYGPGKSLDLWTRYFTNPLVQITFIELDSKCVRRFGERVYKNGKSVSIVSGDQTNVTLLTEVTRNHGPFDVVIDDGGHSFNQQRISIEYFLLRGLRNSGILFVEDMHTSFLWKPGSDGAQRTSRVVNQLGDALLSSGLPARRFTIADPTVRAVVDSVLWFGCQRQACFFRKI